MYLCKIQLAIVVTVVGGTLAGCGVSGDVQGSTLGGSEDSSTLKGALSIKGNHHFHHFCHISAVRTS